MQLPRLGPPMDHRVWRSYSGVPQHGPEYVAFNAKSPHGPLVPIQNSKCIRSIS
ncbi:hypothetical protein LguiA_025898 [Lonicera macranthoides]